MDAQCCVLVKFYERKQTAGISLCSIRRRSHAFGNTLVRPNARVNIYITRRTSHSPSHQKPIKNSYVRCHFLSCSVRRITRFFMIALWGRDHKHRVLRESLFRWVVIRGCSMCESVAALTPPPPINMVAIYVRNAGVVAEVQWHRRNAVGCIVPATVALPRHCGVFTTTPSIRQFASHTI